MRRLLSISALVLSFAVTGALRADEESPAPAPAGDIHATDPLVQLSRGTQALYKKISASLVRVRIDQGYQKMLTQTERREFNEWLKAQQTATAQGSRPMLTLFRRFLEQKLSDPQTTPQDGERWKTIQNHLQMQIPETTGVVLDDQGNVLVFGNWVKEGPPLSIRVTLADGSETTAKYVGGHPARGLAIIALDSSGKAPALRMAQNDPDAGDLLMCMSVNSGAVSLIVDPGPSPRHNSGEQRFAIPGNEDRGATLEIDTNGELAAVGSDRYALPISFLKRDLQWIIENKHDIVPRQIGVKYSPVPPALRKSARLLANRPAVVVEDVAAGSLAEKAGLQKNDIVITIDHRPIIQLPQIQADMATETAPVPIGILRDNKELTLSMPLD